MTLRPYLQHSPKLGQRVFIDPQSAVIGQVTLGDDVSVWPMAVVRGDMHRIDVGARTSIQDGAVLHITHASAYHPEGYPLSIGDDVTIGHNACLHGCTIENEVLIGIGSIVLDGAYIESHVMLAAGSLVSPGSCLASGYLYKGAPAKQARLLTTEEIAFFQYSAQNYCRLKDSFLQQAEPSKML